MTVSAVRLEGTWTVRPLVMASPVEVLTLVRVAAPAALCGEYAHTYVAFTCGRMSSQHVSNVVIVKVAAIGLVQCASSCEELAADRWIQPHNALCS
jgi:hypothetical protein